MFSDVLELRPQGLYCPAGDFFVDPWRSVPRAVITHAHSDHARHGCGSYLSTQASAPFLKWRLGSQITLDTLPYGESLRVKDALISLVPAGHILGSCQVRIEVAGKVAVVTGDFKREPDPTCEAFEPVRCHLLVTESTFGLPVFRWLDSQIIAEDINAWWLRNQRDGRTSILYAYALGKSQRLLNSLDPSIGAIYLHGAVTQPTDLYQQQGKRMPTYQSVSKAPSNTRWSDGLVLAVPSAHGTPWMRRFGDVSTAMASGWMAVRGNRRRRNMDRGFVLSDHVDWPGLMQTVFDCNPEAVWVTHGFTAVVARHLGEKGIAARVLATEFLGESLEGSDSENSEILSAAEDAG